MSKFVDSIIGHAVGDAMGVPTEFCIREYLLRDPVKEMIGSAKTGQPAGSWSDDTSMEIATIDSFIQNKTFNYDDIMTKWEEWINEAKYTPNNDIFPMLCQHFFNIFHTFCLHYSLTSYITIIQKANIPFNSPNTYFFRTFSVFFKYQHI